MIGFQKDDLIGKHFTELLMEVKNSHHSDESNKKPSLSTCKTKGKRK
jgi:hypothetical protein